MVLGGERVVPNEKPMRGGLLSLVLYTALAAYATAVVLVRSYVFTLLLPLVGEVVEEFF